MNHQLKFYLSDFYRNEPGVTDEDITRFEVENGFSLPADYAAVLKEFNGGEGLLFLFALEELREVNEDYFNHYDQVPDYFVIGKDAAVTGVGFHKYLKTYHVFPLPPDDFSSLEFDFSGNSFEEVLHFFYHEWSKWDDSELDEDDSEIE